MTRHVLNNSDTNMPMEIAPGEIHIWHIKLDQPVDNTLSELLSSDETQRAERFKQAPDRNRFIRSHGAMRSILGCYLGVSGNLLEFGFGENGKPHLTNPVTSIEFNLSHCEDRALLAVADNIPVGIDLERIRVRASQLKIAKRLFPKPIYIELFSLPADKVDDMFLQHWTELEARAKCVGSGIFSTQNGQDDLLTSHFHPVDGWVGCIASAQQDTDTLNLQHLNFRN